MSSEHKTYKTPCPNCDGTVESFWYSSDCRGNPGGGGINCQGECKRDFTVAEWQIIAKDEMREIKKEEALTTLAFKAKYLMETLITSPDSITELERELFSGNYPYQLNSELARLHQQLIDYTEAYQKMQEI